MVAVKAGVNAAVILATERLAKRNRVAAVATMVALNSAYAMIVRHNLRVAEQLPAR